MGAFSWCSRTTHACNPFQQRLRIFCSEKDDKNYNRKGERLPVANNTCNERETLKHIYLWQQNLEVSELSAFLVKFSILVLAPPLLLGCKSAFCCQIKKTHTLFKKKKNNCQAIILFVCSDNYLPWPVVVQLSAVLASGLLQFCWWRGSEPLHSRASWPIEKRIQNLNNTLKHIHKCWKCTELLEGEYTTFWKKCRTKTSFHEGLGTMQQKQEIISLKILLQLVDAPASTAVDLPAISMFPVSLSECQILLYPGRCLHWAEACVRADCKSPSR